MEEVGVVAEVCLVQYLSLVQKFVPYSLQRAHTPHLFTLSCSHIQGLPGQACLTALLLPQLCSSRA